MPTPYRLQPISTYTDARSPARTRATAAGRPSTIGTGPSTAHTAWVVRESISPSAKASATAQAAAAAARIASDQRGLYSATCSVRSRNISPPATAASTDSTPTWAVSQSLSPHRCCTPSPK